MKENRRMFIKNLAFKHAIFTARPLYDQPSPNRAHGGAIFGFGFLP